MQRGYLDTIDTRLNAGAPPSDEIRALLKGELRAVDGMIAKALPVVTDTVTRRHLQDARDSIAETLDPRAMRTRPGVLTLVGGRGVGAADPRQLLSGVTIGTTKRRIRSFISRRRAGRTFPAQLDHCESAICD